MYVVSNREADDKREPELIFCSDYNRKNPDELRLAKVTRVADGGWEVDLLPEKRVKRQLKVEERPSWKLFRDLQARMKEQKRDCVFFVHGYNVNIASAYESAWHLEQTYGVEVILFAWPAQGGGDSADVLGDELLGTASYKRDKRVARNSIGALERCLETLALYLVKSNTDCGQSFNLLCHSMGNYLLQKLIESGEYEQDTVLFDNIVLCSADANNPGHRDWVDQLKPARHIYVCINENDFALRWSQRKLGREQKARLGNTVANLNANKAIYLDFTDADGIGRSHGYFDPHDSRLEAENMRVVGVFDDLLHGRRAERKLAGYEPYKRIYAVR